MKRSVYIYIRSRIWIFRKWYNPSILSAIQRMINKRGCQKLERISFITFSSFTRDPLQALISFTCENNARECMNILLPYLSATPLLSRVAKAE